MNTEIDSNALSLAEARTLFPPSPPLKSTAITAEFVEANRDPNCKRCYGKGHTGRDVKKNQFLVCRCVIDRSRK